ncbi:hypothetical protein CCMSSC00406_0010212 [Pleurotus cornucopiae]|uniref:Uncharacterized protein n=1 Tax=Pleurotus cornucopiae TaxID=5321 RepID=A0ACB7IRR7_PLECO|nr:hypothetical protein CCMSSC00406_0010212 [Pleurotus cornucopiae]
MESPQVTHLFQTHEGEEAASQSPATSYPQESDGIHDRESHRRIYLGSIEQGPDTPLKFMKPPASSSARLPVSCSNSPPPALMHYVSVITAARALRRLIPSYRVHLRILFAQPSP